MKTFYTLFKTQFITALILCLALTVNAQTEKETTTKGQTITVTVDNLKNNNGVVLFGLHTKDTWMKAAGVQNLKSKSENGKVTVTFTNVKAGTYAILVLHDENENNRMDFENGMPKENYGMSNNPMSFGPPQFEESKFEVKNKDLEFNIRF